MSQLAPDDRVIHSRYQELGAPASVLFSLAPQRLVFFRTIPSSSSRCVCGVRTWCCLLPRSRRTSGPELERSWLLLQANMARGWLELPYVLEHGRPPARERRGHRDTRNFAPTMAEGDPAIMDEVIDRCLEYLHAEHADGGGAPPDGAGNAREERQLRVLDVGGAAGHLARRFADRGHAATLFERPEVLPVAQEHLGEGAGVEMAGGDFLEELPLGPFDMVFLGNVYHLYGPQADAALTQRAFACLAPGGAIAIRDYVLDRSPRAPLFAVNMLLATEEGGVWSEPDFRGWLDEAGFVDIRIVDLEMVPNQLILGIRP